MRPQSPGNSEPLVEFTGVSKWYGPVMALNGVTVQLEPAITGLVGPNGAGKSTLFKLLTGQLRPSLGTVKVRGVDAWRARAKRHIGFCPDADAFYEEMSGRAFVQTMARWHGYSGRAARRRCEEVLEQVGMVQRADRPLGSYSKGMRQRIKLAQALVHDPDLIVLDEPLNGVDPVGRRELVELFRQLAAGGKTVLVSSHVLDEMDTLADRILFICRGRILASGSLDEVRDLLADYPLKVRIASDRLRELSARVLTWESVEGIHFDGRDRAVLEVRRPAEFFKSFGELVVAENFGVGRLEILDASTEAVFEYLMEQARKL